MAIIDVVKWDGSPDIFAWKFPENNLTTWTQLIVNESQEAVLFHKGKLIAKFGSGKHVLSTENIPILENLYGIPFGGQNPFTAEVWFVNRVVSLDVKWGTRQPFQIRDPQYEVMVPVRANGLFGVQISDSEPFLVKLVGTLPIFDKNTLTDYFRGIVLTKATAIIAKKIAEEKVCVLDIAAQIDLLSESLQRELQQEFGKYGISLVNFFINQISVPEDDRSVSRLKSLLSKRAEMNLLGYTYQQERSYDVLADAAQNSSGTAGTIMGAGMGLGMGFGVGGAVGGMMQGVAQEVRQPQPAQSCPKCKSSIPGDAEFCPKCGSAIKASAAEEPAKITTCDKCGREIPSGSKFCPECGDAYNPCAKCGADIPAGAAVCPKCGDKQPVPCPQCGTAVEPGTRFCPQCGTQQGRLCSGCQSEVGDDCLYCPQCGTKIDRP